MPRPASPTAPKRPLSPSSLRDLSSPTAPLARPAPFPAPPTGHDLMSLFPPTPPALRDLDILAGVDRPFAEHHNRLSAFQEEVRLRVVGGTYVNTSTWFGSQEREFFKGALREKPWAVSEPPSQSQSQSQSQLPPPSSSSAAPPSHTHPAKRRKSIDVDMHPAMLRLAPSSRTSSPEDRVSTHRVPPPTFPPHSPVSPHGSGSGSRTMGSSSPPTAVHTPTSVSPPSGPNAAAAAAAATKPAPRRRAGKYTKRVFVNPHPSSSSSSHAVSPPSHVPPLHALPSTHGGSLPPPHAAPHSHPHPSALGLPPAERLGAGSSGAGMPPPNLVPVKWGR